MTADAGQTGQTTALCSTKIDNFSWLSHRDQRRPNHHRNLRNAARNKLVGSARSLSGAQLGCGVAARNSPTRRQRHHKPLALPKSRRFVFRCLEIDGHLWLRRRNHRSECNRVLCWFGERLRPRCQPRLRPPCRPRSRCAPLRSRTWLRFVCQGLRRNGHHGIRRHRDADPNLNVQNYSRAELPPRRRHPQGNRARCLTPLNRCQRRPACRIGDCNLGAHPIAEQARRALLGQPETYRCLRNRRARAIFYYNNN